MVDMFVGVCVGYVVVFVFVGDGSLGYSGFFRSFLERSIARSFV